MNINVRQIRTSAVEREQTRREAAVTLRRCARRDMLLLAACMLNGLGGVATCILAWAGEWFLPETAARFVGLAVACVGLGCVALALSASAVFATASAVLFAGVAFMVGERAASMGAGTLLTGALASTGALSSLVLVSYVWLRYVRRPQEAATALLRHRDLKKPEGQCASCMRWRTIGGTILPPVEGCGWFDDEEGQSLSPALRELLGVLATLAAREGLCPAHLPIDLQ